MPFVTLDKNTMTPRKSVLNFTAKVSKSKGSK